MESLARPASYIHTAWQFIRDIRVVDKAAETHPAPEQDGGSHQHLVAVKGVTQSGS